MKCPKCGYENAPDAELCNLCRAVRFVKAGSTTSAKPLAGKAAPTRKHRLDRAGAPAVELAPGQVFTFGRGTDCSLPIPSNRVSRVHAEITWNDGKPVLTDKGSSNGTFVGGKRIKEHALSPGDEIEIGPFLCTYQIGEPKPAAAAPVLESKTMLDAGDLLAGQIGEAGLVEVVQGVEFNGKTGTLRVFSRDGDGWIAFKDGQPLSAEADPAKDEEAILTLLSRKQGRFTFTSDLEDPTKRVKANVTSLLLEWGRRADEASGQAAAE